MTLADRIGQLAWWRWFDYGADLDLAAAGIEAECERKAAAAKPNLVERAYEDGAAPAPAIAGAPDEARWREWRERA